MHRVTPLLLIAAGIAGGCSPVDVVVEVLPPRTSVSCSAPDKSAAALGRGLLDVLATVGTHGAYVADLRLTVKGQDARVDGVSVTYTLPGGASTTSTSTAEAVAGDVVVGDVRLLGEGEDVRTAIVEHVELIPRELAVALHDDDGLGLDQIEFKTLGVDITPIVNGDAVIGATSSFAVNLCKGCLVQPPEVCAGDGQFALIPVTCRPGQDTPLFTCVVAP
jgi:hypothetical protein